MSSAAAKQAYSREETRRLVGISERQLASWERQKLLEPAAQYGFRELLALQTLVRLRKNRVASSQIRLALDALRKKLRDVGDPLTELKLFADGKKIRVEIDGGAMDAMSGQLLLNFGANDLRRLVQLPNKDGAAVERDRRFTAERWFQRGLDLEQSGAPAEEIIEAYRKAVELDEKSAGALVNLGTIYFNARQFREAEKYYLQALEAEPDYALAHFDLANLYDERGDRQQALKHYEAALRISPNYADAHYNIALLYQGQNQPMKAVRHWSAYLKLDPASHWSAIARRELAKLRQAAVVQGSGK
ncbi:MAG TPA: tetratricopeptide repeat protein [Bryobacteraceae bacterium]|nr:tetratricopeptide repeat protein [Bryobacteraceae bacterium]